MQIKVRDNRYNIYITQLAKRKMELYCELCSDEIGWMAYVDKLADNKGYMITDCILLKQKVHAGTTEIDPLALLELWNSITPELQNKIKCWGHSHVNMSPTPSGQDNDQMKYFEDGNDWFIRIITNKKGELNVDFYDFKNGFEVNNNVLITYAPEFAELRTQITEEIKDKVSKIGTTYTSPSAGTASKSYGYDPDDKYYKNRQRQRTEARKGSNIAPLFSDITVKYLGSIKEALNDPNYWSPVGAY